MRGEGAERGILRPGTLRRGGRTVRGRTVRGRTAALQATGSPWMGRPLDGAASG